MGTQQAIVVAVGGGTAKVSGHENRKAEEGENWLFLIAFRINVHLMNEQYPWKLSLTG